MESAAMIFAAGLGSRLGEETKKKPKALVDIGNGTLLENAINAIKKSGISTIVINVHHFADQIKTYLEAHHNFGITIFISDERERLLETAGGLKKAEHFFSKNSSILLYNVDIVSDIDLEALLTFHKKRSALATLAVSKRETSRYLLMDKALQLRGWMNTLTEEVKPHGIKKEDFQQFGFSGIHVVSPDIFSVIPDAAPRSIMQTYIENCATYNIFGFEHVEVAWSDVGKQETLSKIRKKNNRYLV